MSLLFSRKKPPKEPEKQLQYGVLPYRRRDDGQLEVMLVTSRETRRWIVPKGWPITGLEAHLSAAREAYEEAGLIGYTAPQSVGHYDYVKRRRGGRNIPARVELFPLEVETQLDNWPERDQRETRWFGVEQAAAAVDEAELAAIILALGRHIGRGEPSA